MPTTVHLMRHGEVHNPQHVLYGRLPGYRLSDLGRMMAEVVAGFVKDAGWDVAAVIASPLQRAQETAAPIGGAFGLDVGTDARLIEAGNVFEGSTVGKQPWKLLAPRRFVKLWNPARPSWGEPYTAQVRRMQAAVAAARDAHMGREVILVSHQLPIWITRLAYESKRFVHNPRSRQCALASLTSFTFDGGALTGIEYRTPAAELVPVHGAKGRAR